MGDGRVAAAVGEEQCVTRGELLRRDRSADGSLGLGDPREYDALLPVDVLNEAGAVEPGPGARRIADSSFGHIQVPAAFQVHYDRRRRLSKVKHLDSVIGGCCKIAYKLIDPDRPDSR